MIVERGGWGEREKGRNGEGVDRGWRGWVRALGTKDDGRIWPRKGARGAKIWRTAGKRGDLIVEREE